VSAFNGTDQGGSLDGGRTDAERPPGPSDSLGIVRIRAHFSESLARANHLRKGHFRVEIYPAGVVLERKLGLSIQPVDLPPRGVIDGFSPEASRRLKEMFLKLFVPGFDLAALTLTTHRVHSPAEWRAAIKRFRMRVKRLGWAGLWRVELQRRKTPHAHVAMWLPPSVVLADVAQIWLECVGEENDLLAREHAVKGRKIPHDETGWAVYLALHDGKHKEAQLGWLGKQWGIWNLWKFRVREPERFELTPRQHGQFLRVLRHLDRSAREGMQHRREGWERRDLAAKIAAGEMPADLHVCSGPRPKEKLLHRGNLLRCVRGETVSVIVSAILTGRIYGGPQNG
jgi:hypothetical protein